MYVAEVNYFVGEWLFVKMHLYSSRYSSFNAFIYLVEVQQWHARPFLLNWKGTELFLFKHNSIRLCKGGRKMFAYPFHSLIFLKISSKPHTATILTISSQSFFFFNFSYCCVDDIVGRNCTFCADKIPAGYEFWQGIPRKSIWLRKWKKIRGAWLESLYV